MGSSRGKILVVDDDVDILDLLKYNLVKEGYDVKTLSQSTGVIPVAKHFNPNLIILDIMMPEKNGVDLCRSIRSINFFDDTYIFFLTAKSESYYQHAAFNTGGDDYIEKVIGLKALIKKIGAVLKSNYVIRKGIEELQLGKLKMNRISSAVYIDNKPIALSKPEFDVLFFFAQNPRKEISSDQMMQIIWGSEIYLSETNIDIYIHSLQRKLGPNIIRHICGNRYIISAE